MEFNHRILLIVLGKDETIALELDIPLNNTWCALFMLRTSVS